MKRKLLALVTLLTISLVGSTLLFAKPAEAYSTLCSGRPGAHYNIDVSRAPSSWRNALVAAGSQWNGLANVSVTIGNSGYPVYFESTSDDWAGLGYCHGKIIINTRLITSSRPAATVFVHEVGHVIGLGHSQDPKAVMYPIAVNYKPNPDDIAGLRHIYGAPPGTPPKAPPAPVPPTSSSSNPYHCPSHPALSSGSTGVCVQHLKWYLGKLGYRVRTEGVFAQRFTAGDSVAVKKFKESVGLGRDSTVDGATWNALHSKVGGNRPPTTPTNNNPRPPTNNDQNCSSHPTLRRGSSGACVRHLQTHLHEHGFSLAIDGVFGPQTDNVVRSFQHDRNLSADGIVGPQTWGALHANAYLPAHT